MRSGISLFFVLLFSISVFGQGNVRFGLTFSPTFNWLRLDNSTYENDGLLVGFQYGLLTNFTIDDNPRYAFELGLLSSNTGGNFTMPVPGDTSGRKAMLKARLQYIEIPLTVRLKTNEINYMTFFGQIGLNPSFNVRARADIKVDPDDPDIIGGENLKLNSIPGLGVDGVGLLNVGLLVGGGVEYAIAENTSLMGGLYYNNGFINIIDDGDGEKIVLNSLTVRLGILF